METTPGVDLGFLYGRLYTHIVLLVCKMNNLYTDI